MVEKMEVDEPVKKDSEESKKDEKKEEKKPEDLNLITYESEPGFCSKAPHLKLL